MKLTYRPEIDGLRAIAVGAVILYHAQFTILGYQPFKGGFIGVDIFFVISGYLITSIILKELVTTGSFSFKHFYKRRIRRILPALLFVMLVSLPFAWMYLLPSSFTDFSKSILYSLGFTSNFYFHYSGQQYGAESGFLKPFLHTWSLSVEEQYYILFPIVLLITFKYFRKHLVHILALGFVISLGLAEWTSRNYPSISFYFIHTRMWELLAGSILAYFEITNGKRIENKTLYLILPTIGLLLIGYSILFFNDEMFHPSFYTLAPIIGVCLIIWFSNKNELITKILSTKLFVGIGLISYSLYLWHYPIFVFSRITSFTDSNILKKLILVSAVFILSILSYFFIEKLFRNKNFNFKKVLFVVSMIIGILVIFTSYSLYKDGGINKFNIMISDATSSPLYRADCKFSTSKPDFLNENFFKKDFLECKKKYNKFILILGDSHSIDLFNSISKVSKNNEFIVGLNRGGCRPLDKNSKDCHYDNALKFIENFNKNIKYILFTHKGSYFLTNIGREKDFSDSKQRKLPLNLIQIKNTISYLKIIKKLNSNLIFVGPHIEPNISYNYKSIKNFLNKSFDDKSNYDLIYVDKKLKELSTQNNIKYLSKIDILDYKFDKDFIVDENLTFSDTDHWSEFGEVYFGKKLVFNSILKDILFP
jgi:peptidoglycan/LPS O-acetylase OafA/YrhL